MHVRPARPGDAETLRAAVSRAGEATVFDDTGAPLLDVSAAGVREAAASAECCFLAEDEDKPVGIAIAHPDAEGSEAELLALWIHPEYTGSDVAEQLLSRVAQALLQSGVTRLRTSIEDTETGVLEFYQLHGFTRRERTEARASNAPGRDHDTVLVASVTEFK